MGAIYQRSSINNVVILRRHTAPTVISLLTCVSLLAPGMAHAAENVATAARMGEVDEVRELLTQGSSANQVESDGSTAALWAAYQSDLELLDLLISAGADLDAANNLGISPLLQAARVGDAAFVSALVEAGANVDAATLKGETALMAAARAGGADAVTLLLEQGSDPNAVEDYQGQSALMWAAAEGHDDVVSLLLRSGADPDLQARISDLTDRSVRTDFPTGGFTAAMWAAREGHEGVLQVLASADADLDVLNGDGASALSIAIVNDRFDLAASLVGLGSDPDDGSLFRAVEMRDAPTDWRAKDGSRLRADYPNEIDALGLMRVLLEAGADPNKPFSGQNHSTSMCCDSTANGTPFSRAATAADVDGLRMLVEFGADVEWTPEPSEGGGRGRGGGGRGGSGPRTPLQTAMDGGRGTGMAGGPGDIREGGEIPFREVANRDTAEAMAVLLDGGANPNREMSNGSTLLHDAAQARRLDVVEVLASHGAQLDAFNGDGLTALDISEGRRVEGSDGGGRRGGGPQLGGGFPGGGRGGGDDQPTQEEIAARLRELMEEAGLPIVEHGVVPGGSAE